MEKRAWHTGGPRERTRALPPPSPPYNPSPAEPRGARRGGRQGWARAGPSQPEPWNSACVSETWDYTHEGFSEISPPQGPGKTPTHTAHCCFCATPVARTHHENPGPPTPPTGLSHQESPVRPSVAP